MTNKTVPTPPTSPKKEEKKISLLSLLAQDIYDWRAVSFFGLIFVCNLCFFSGYRLVKSIVDQWPGAKPDVHDSGSATFKVHDSDSATIVTATTATSAPSKTATTAPAMP